MTNLTLYGAITFFFTYYLPDENWLYVTSANTANQYSREYLDQYLFDKIIVIRSSAFIYFTLGVEETRVRVTIGYVGSAANPEKIILNDFLFGTIYWTTDQFMENWEILITAA